MPKIIVEKGNERGRSILLSGSGSLLVGRDPKAHIQISDTMSSRQHFKIFTRDGKYFIRDLKSSNGTWVNGKRVDEDELQLNDQIRIGETLMSFVSENYHAASDPVVGKSIDGYKMLARVGRGGMGTVYRAQQTSLNRTVAMKILSQDLVKDKTFIDLFRQEARAAAQLNHPNIVQVYDVGREESTNTYYIAMEYVGKGSLQERIGRAKKLSLEVALPFMIDSARGLEYAHRKNIVHRDIKPDNLMVNEEGVVKICDLGLAKNLSEAPNEDEGIFGTPHYIAPEQALGKPVDTRADIYALGATFYRILAGRTPFSGPTVKDIVKKQIKEEPSPLNEVVPELPQNICDIIHKMMRKNPEERYQNPTDLLNELEALKLELDGAAPLAERSTVSAGSGRSWKWLTGLVAALLLTAVVWGVVSSMGGNGTEPDDTIHGNGGQNGPPLPIGLSEAQKDELSDIHDHYGRIQKADPCDEYTNHVKRWVKKGQSYDRFFSEICSAGRDLNPADLIEKRRGEADEAIVRINKFMEALPNKDLHAEVEKQIAPFLKGYEDYRNVCASIGVAYEAAKTHVKELNDVMTQDSDPHLIRKIEMGEIARYQGIARLYGKELPAMNEKFYSENGLAKRFFAPALELGTKEWMSSAEELQNLIQETVETEISDERYDELVAEHLRKVIDDKASKANWKNIDALIETGRGAVLGHLEFLKDLKELDQFSSQYKDKKSQWTEKISGMKALYIEAWKTKDTEKLLEAWNTAQEKLAGFDYAGAKDTFVFPENGLRSENSESLAALYMKSIDAHKTFFEGLAAELENVDKRKVRIPFVNDKNQGKECYVENIDKDELKLKIGYQPKDKPSGTTKFEEFDLKEAPRAWIPALWIQSGEEDISRGLAALDFMYFHWTYCSNPKNKDTESARRIWELAKELVTKFRSADLDEKQKKTLSRILEQYDSKDLGFYAENAEQEVAEYKKTDPNRAREVIKTMRLNYKDTDYVKTRAASLEGEGGVEDYFRYLESLVDEAEMQTRYAEIVEQLNKDLPAIYKRIRGNAKNFCQQAENRRKLLTSNLYSACSGHMLVIEKIGGNKDREQERVNQLLAYLIPELMDLESFTSNNFNASLKQYDYIDSSYAMMWRVKAALMSGQSKTADSLVKDWLDERRDWQKKNKKGPEEGMWAFNQAKAYFENYETASLAHEKRLADRATLKWHDLGNQWGIISYYLPGNHTPGDFSHEYKRNTDYLSWRIEMEYYRTVLEAYRQKISTFNMYDDKYFPFWWNWLECMHFFGDQKAVLEAAKIIEENYTKQYGGFISSRIEDDPEGKKAQQVKEYKIKLKLLYYKLFADYVLGGGKPLPDAKGSLIKETKTLWKESKNLWEHFDLLFQFISK